jgi:hypothetical protein
VGVKCDGLVEVMYDTCKFPTGVVGSEKLWRGGSLYAPGVIGSASSDKLGLRGGSLYAGPRRVVDTHISRKV